MSRITSNKKNKSNTKMLNVKFPEEDYEKLKHIAHELGDMTLSSMIRMIVQEQLKKVENTGDPKSFINLK